MDRVRRVSSLLIKTRQKDEHEGISKSFMENGAALLEELIVSFKGKHNIPIRSFTSLDLIRATNGYEDWVMNPGNGDIFKGLFEQCPVLVRKKKYSDKVIHDIVITSQMSHHKNVLKLLGCCLESEVPVVVYEFAGTTLLTDLLYCFAFGRYDDTSIWSLKSRVKIAMDVANVVVYLHTSFPRPIIHRGIKIENIILDTNGVTKIFDFSVCILLPPPGELQVVEDRAHGTMSNNDPEYKKTGIVTEKIDVYCFGVLLLQLLTGRPVFTSYTDFYEKYGTKERLNKIFDMRILGKRGETEEEDELLACLRLALSCVHERGVDRPEMINVAKELRRIYRSLQAC